mmetsp:Transcript_41601/g.61019  ORF Transcript_41601/g.61019 Transcript_41601/m.61019 type:complete len:257 (-) Transcript_41601:1275-2045(-)
MLRLLLLVTLLSIPCMRLLLRIALLIVSAVLLLSRLLMMGTLLAIVAIARVVSLLLHSASLSSGIRMIRAHLNHIPQHALGALDSLSGSLERNLTILTRRYILINLDVASALFLQIINGGPFLANDSTHIHFGTREDFCLHSRLAPVMALVTPLRLLVRVRLVVAPSSAHAPVLIVTSVPTTLIAAGASNHADTAVGHAGIRRTRAPTRTTGLFLFHQHIQCHHGIHSGIASQEQNHLLGLLHTQWSSRDGYSALI